jgi:hypothetical protein
MATQNRIGILSARATENMRATLCSHENACATVPHADCALILDALERDRVVAVLDAWAQRKSYETDECYSWQSVPLCGQAEDECLLKVQGAIRWSYLGASPEAARAAAAKAIEAGML